jgi:membrane protein
MATAIRKFLLANLLPDKAGAMIAKYVTQFAQKAEGLTWVSVATLTVTALAQMLTIEHAFNAIWIVRESRPLLKRIAMHLMTLFLGPAVFGGSLAATTYLASASLGLVEDWRLLTGSILRVLSFLTVAGVFGLLYWKVPNRSIVGTHAGVGGLFAALGFSIIQWLFAGYVASIPGYRAIYGAFAVVPVFLLWLYLSWSVILLGALITAELGGVRARSRR